MSAKTDNQPELELRIRVVKRAHDGSATAVIQSLLRDGSYAILWRQDWPSGRPDPHQLVLLAAQLADLSEESIVGLLGVQGTIT